jgi:Holliday junction resolvase RusA-like endonuclease
MLSKVNFTIPSLPASINAIYNFIPHQRRVELKPECRLWKSQSKEYIPRFAPSGESVSGMIKIEVTLHYNFYYKNMKVKKVDSQNMLKLIIDACSEKIGIDDSYFKHGSWSSVQANDEKVIVTLEEMP